MSPNKIFILFFFIVVLIGLAAWIKIYWRERKLTFNILRKELLKLPRFRIWLLLLSLAFVCLFTGFYCKYDRLRAKAVITLNYSEAYKGQNANGTRYNMNEIICEDVLKRAIEMGAVKGVTARELQECLTVEPVVEGRSEEENGYHISTEFEVVYKGTEALNTAADNIAMLIGYAYKEYCIGHYADNFDSLDIQISQEEDFADLDYLDIAIYLDKQVEDIQNFMYGMADKSASFIASDGETFYSLAAKCRNLSDVQIQNNLKGYLLNNGVSKNADEYISRLEYDNTRMDYDYQKAVAGFDVRRDAIALYDEEMTKIVLVPTWDMEGEYYMGRTKVGIDQLSVEAEEKSRMAANYFKEMEIKKSIIDSYSKTHSRGMDAYADAMIDTISSEIMELAGEAKRVGQEYSETRMNKYISVVVDDSSFIKYVIFAGVLYIMFYLAVNALIQQRGDDEKEGRRV